MDETGRGHGNGNGNGNGIWMKGRSRIHGYGALSRESIDEGRLIGYVHLPDQGMTELGLMINHSEDPSCFARLEAIGWTVSLVAARPIRPGEELTANYDLGPWFFSRSDPKWKS